MHWKVRPACEEEENACPKSLLASDWGVSTSRVNKIYSLCIYPSTNSTETSWNGKKEWKDTAPNGWDFWPYGNWAGALSWEVNFCLLEQNVHSAPQTTLQAKHSSRYQTEVKYREAKWEKKNTCLDLQFLTSGETAKSFLPFILAHLSRCLWACFTLPLAMSHRADSGTHLQVQGEETPPVGAACSPPHTQRWLWHLCHEISAQYNNCGAWEE